LKPDMMLMSKGMTSAALPLSGVAVTEEVFRGMFGGGSFTHFYSTGGHPVSCAVAKKNLEIIIEENLVENSARVGKYMLERLGELEESPYIDGVEGLGLFAGFEVVKDKATKAKFDPAVGAPRKLVEGAHDRGLLIRSGGGTDRIQVAPPLIATAGDIDQIMDILKAAIAELKFD